VKVFAGIAGVTLGVSIAALIVGVASVTQTCEATSGDTFAFGAGLVCACIGAAGGLAAIVQAVRRRRARPDFWWYLGIAAACAVTVVVSTFATAYGFTLCID
jgi:hypothetical protein